MAKLRVGTSYWLDAFSGKPPRYPTLRGRHEVDVAVIGGGLTGCVAAYKFAQAGLHVAMLEARQVGRGSTAASTALVMQEPDLDFRDLASRYGTRRARRIWQESAASLRGLVRLVRALRIDAALEHVPSVYWTPDQSTARELRLELRRRHSAGLSGKWLSPEALARETGIHGGGGILTRGNAQCDPYRTCLGLAEHARQLGADLYERSPARRVKGNRHGVQITLDAGEVRARWAVISTGYATPEFKPLAGRFRMLNTYVIATAPITTTLARRSGLKHVMLWDTETPYHYARWTPDRRLLFGGRDRPRVRGPARVAALAHRANELQGDLVGWFPELARVRIDFAWEGLFATTPDGLPFIGTHRRYPNQLFALGYGGNGMTFTHLATEILLRALRGNTVEEDKFLGFGRIR